jgi:hypothetical protein
MNKFPSQFNLPARVADALIAAAESMAADPRKAFRISRRGARGDALKPGPQTPLWNSLVTQVRPHLKTHGESAKLARLLGLHRQAIHSYFTAGTRLPDAERTLQLLAWLAAKKQNQPAS